VKNSIETIYEVEEDLTSGGHNSQLLNSLRMNAERTHTLPRPLPKIKSGDIIEE